MEYLGEEVGNQIDPSATAISNKQQYAFIMALEQAADVRACMDVTFAASNLLLIVRHTAAIFVQAELGGTFDETKGEDGPSWSALMDHDFPLNQAGVYTSTYGR